MLIVLPQFYMKALLSLYCQSTEQIYFLHDLPNNIVNWTYSTKKWAAQQSTRHRKFNFIRERKQFRRRKNAIQLPPDNPSPGCNITWKQGAVTILASLSKPIEIEITMHTELCIVIKAHNRDIEPSTLFQAPGRPLSSKQLILHKRVYTQWMYTLNK